MNQEDGARSWNARLYAEGQGLIPGISRDPKHSIEQHSNATEITNGASMQERQRDRERMKNTRSSNTNSTFSLLLLDSTES